MVSLSLFPILGTPKTLGIMFLGALCMVVMAAIGAGIAGVTKVCAPLRAGAVPRRAILFCVAVGTAFDIRRA